MRDPLSDDLPVRVLQVVTDDDRRGAQVFACELQRALAEPGWQIDTVALAPGRVGGLDICTLGRSRHSLGTIRALRRKSRHADIVVAHGSTTLPVTALATFGLSCPFVYRQISDSLYWAPTRGHRARVRVGLMRAACVVALWDGAARTLVGRFGVPVAKLRIVPNGVKAADWQLPSASEREAARRGLGLPLDRPVVTFVGALAQEKGPDLAVRTVSAIPEVHLLVVGAGPEEGRTRAVASEMLDGRATFIGSIPRIWDIYAATDVLLFPSRGGDSMPAVVIEAGLMGVPTVATDTGALGSMIERGVTGEVVAEPDHVLLAAALLGVLEPERRVAMGSAARQAFLERYDIGPVARQWFEVLDAVVESRRRSGRAAPSLPDHAGWASGSPDGRNRDAQR
jgi:glycosyltransferase involved in cell wall biosynthesis